MAGTVRRSHKKIVVPALLALLLLAVAGSLALGSSGLHPGQALSALFGGGTATAQSIVRFVRLPRTLGAVLCGAAFALSGAVIQGVLSNPLASPNIIGVNAGAGFGAILCGALAPAASAAVPLAAFAGALGACLLVFTIARRTGASRITLVLAGVAISSMFSAGIDAVATLVPDALLHANTFMVGGLSGVTLRALVLPGALIVAAGLGTWLLRYEVDLLSLGEETALSVGLSAQTYRYLLLTLAAALAGAAVSFAGLIGFVGLIVPHACRALVGGESRDLFPACALMGALLVTACDLLARILFAPYELPVGILLSLLGGPFFLWLLVRQRGGGRYDRAV